MMFLNHYQLENHKEINKIYNNRNKHLNNNNNRKFSKNNKELHMKNNKNN